MALKDEIGKVNAFDCLEEEVYLNLSRTADALRRGVEELLKRRRLSQTQYNVLRILRGAGEKGLSCREVGRRMITRDPDTTRLFDRLEERGLLTRQRQTEDRRVVQTTITPAGATLVTAMDKPMIRLHQQQLGHLGERKLKALSKLLEEARTSAETTGTRKRDAESDA